MSTPKTVFSHPSFIASMLVAAGYDEPRIVRAVNGSRGSATLVSTGEVKATALRDAKGSKGAEFEFGETETARYRGKMDAPAQWAKYCDAFAAFAKKHGAPSGELTPAIIPEGHAMWLAVFLPKPATPVQTPAVQTPATPATPVAEVKPGKSGKRNGSMHVADAVQPA
jgi:hypothetical protein